MNISLTPKLEGFVKAKVKTGDITMRVRACVPIQNAEVDPKYRPSLSAVSAVTAVCSLASRSIRVRGTPTARATA